MNETRPKLNETRSAALASAAQPSGLLRRYCDANGIDEQSLRRMDVQTDLYKREQRYHLSQVRLSEARSEAMQQEDEYAEDASSQEKAEEAVARLGEIVEKLIRAIRQLRADVDAQRRKLADVEDSIPVAAVEAAKAIWEESGR